MTVLTTLERKFGRYIPENITKYLLIGQVLSYLLVYARPEYHSYFTLTGRLLLKGEIWRLVTILIAPASESVLFVVFAWYFFYILGTALEQQWGSFRYVVYLALSYFAVILFSLLFQNVSIASGSLYLSLFLAFAYLNPNFKLLLFFIIPIKLKWLAYIAWAGLIATILLGSIQTKILTLLSISNFLIFFYEDLLYTVRTGFKGASHGPKKALHKEKPHHICAVCGKNERDNPDMEIRYCSTCFPQTCYCGEHANNHQHKRAVN